MISANEYPMGDGQTWVGSSGPSQEDLQLLEDYLGDIVLAKEFAHDGVRVECTPNRKVPESNQQHLLDTISGLPFCKKDDQFVLHRQRLCSPQHNIVDTCFFRDYLRGDAPGQTGFVLTTSMTGGALDRYPETGFLSSPIVEYEARTRYEFDKIVDEVEEKLNNGPYFRRLWLRGQRAEYLTSRRAIVCDALGFGRQGNSLPSLIPSLGRYARVPGNNVDYDWVSDGPNHWWKKPFLVWIIRSNPQWLSNYPEFAKRIEDSLHSDDDSLFSKILSDIRFDPRVPSQVDDLRQWFLTHYKYGAFICVLQQYGYYSSMLDITTDPEVALFFAQSQMEQGQMKKIDPPEGRVIYLFAESRNQSNFFEASDIDWGDSDWNSGIPPRVEKQAAGAIFGSSAKSQNLYGHYIVARILLKGPECHSRLSTADLFPSEHNDLLYRTLRESLPPLEGLY